MLLVVVPIPAYLGGGKIHKNTPFGTHKLTVFYRHDWHLAVERRYWLLPQFGNTSREECMQPGMDFSLSCRHHLSDHTGAKILFKAQMMMWILGCGIKVQWMLTFLVSREPNSVSKGSRHLLGQINHESKKLTSHVQHMRKVRLWVSQWASVCLTQRNDKTTDHKHTMTFQCLTTNWGFMFTHSKNS